MSLVFGTCVRADSGGTFAFFRVEGEIDDRGQFMRLSPTTARRQFPNRGAVRARNVPAHGRYGTFTVIEDPNFDRYASDPYGAKFKAVPTTSHLYQVLFIEEAFASIDVVAGKLRDGVTILGEVVSRTPIFILFSDHVLCGPIFMKAVETRTDHFVLDQQEWTKLKPAYRKFSDAYLLEINVPQFGNVFFTPLPERNPDIMVDLAPVDFALRKVLEMVKQSEGITSQLTNAKIRELAGLIANITPTPDLKPRIEALMKRLRTVDVATTEFAELLHRCLALPNVQHQIEVEASNAKASALSEFNKQQAVATEALERQKAEIASESSKVAALSEKKELLEKEVQSLLASVETSRAKFNEAIVEAAQGAEKDIIGFFSKIAIMRPFLSDSKGPTGNETKAFLPVQWLKAEAKTISDTGTAVKRMTDKLKQLGVGQRTAFNVSTEIVSALAVGQAVAFRGSLASLAATVVTQTLSGGSLVVVEVPVGTRLQINVRALAQSESDLGVGSGVLVNGANRSCIDAYGGEVVETVRLRMTWVLPRTTPPHVYFSLREGPSTLPRTPQIAK